MGSMPAPQTQSVQYSGRIRTPEERAMSKMQLQDYKMNRALALGIRKGDPAALRQFYGMQANATPEQYQMMRNRVRNEISPELYSILNTPHTTDAWTKAQEAKQAQSAGMAGTVGVDNPYTAQAKAKGGIMQLRKFATGGGLSSSQKQFVKDMAKLANSGKELTQAQQDRLNKIETDTGINVSPYSQTGTKTPGDPAIAQAATTMQSKYTEGKKPPPEGTGQDTTKPFTPSDLAVQTPGMGLVDVIDPTTGKPTGGKNIAYTDPAALAASNAIMNNKMPTQFGQAADMYGQTYQGLQGLTNFTPQNVTASQMGPIANISAQQASAQQASAERATAAQMAAIKDVQAQKLQRYQMEGKVPEVTTKDLEAYQMAGPGSWTEEGVQQKYMSPYMQGVIDISKREAERDYLKQANALNAKAISAGAFGGSRQALERSEAQRNYNQQLQDLQVKGLQQAYESGRSQYGQELSLSQQAALQNLQSKLSTQSQSSQQQLQAMLANQSIDYQTKVQNLQAMLGVQSQEAQQMLQAALANQQTQFGVGSLNANLANQTALQNAQLGTQASMTNAQLGTQASLANAQNALQASMANQQTQFGVGSLNANLAQQAALANQQAGIAGAGVNLNAYNTQQNAAQGILGVGQANAGFNQQQIQNLGNLANTNLTYGGNIAGKNAANAYNALYGYTQGTPASVGGGGSVNYQQVGAP